MQGLRSRRVSGRRFFSTWSENLKVRMIGAHRQLSCRPGHLNVVFVDPRCQFEINQIVSTKRCLKADSQRISSLRDSNKLFSPLNPRPLENRVQTFHQRTPFWPSSIISRHVCIYRLFCFAICALVYLLSRPGYRPSWFFFCEWRRRHAASARYPTAIMP